MAAFYIVGCLLAWVCWFIHHKVGREPFKAGEIPNMILLTLTSWFWVAVTILGSVIFLLMKITLGRRESGK